MIPPKSLVHARAELQSLQRDYQEFNDARNAGKKIDTRQMTLTMDRLRYLRNWIKAEADGKTFPCRNCVIAERLFKMFRDGKSVEEIRMFLHEASFGKNHEIIDVRLGKDKGDGEKT